MRTKTESIAGLLEAIERAKQQKDFNILKDLKELRGKFGKVQKRDYLALLDKLMGRSEFKGISPVDAFCGRWDTHL